MCESLHGGRCEIKKRRWPGLPSSAPLPLCVLFSKKDKRTGERDRKGRTMEEGRKKERERWREGGIENRARERGKAWFAVVLVSSQVKDLINMGARSRQSQHQHTTLPFPSFPAPGPRHLKLILIDHCYSDMSCKQRQRTNTHGHVLQLHGMREVCNVRYHL